MKNRYFRLKSLLVLTIIMIVAFGLCATTTFAKTQTLESSDLNISYCNLSFENEVHLVYAIKSDNQNAKLLVWDEPQNEYINGTQTASIAPQDSMIEIDGSLYIMFKYKGLTAKNMTDNLYVRVYISSTGEYGEVYKYSILQYAYNKLGKTGIATDDENLKEVLNTMLDYGAAVQNYLDYNLDRLATDNYVQVKLEGGTFLDGFTDGLYKPDGTITITAPETNSIGEVFTQWVDKDGSVMAKTSTYSLTVGEFNNTYTAVYKEPSQGLYFSRNSIDTCRVSVGDCTDTDIIIPSVSPEGYKVIGITSNAFLGKNITSIIIPASITSIDEKAFFSCENLESVTFSANSRLKSISKTAFYGCSSLSNIEIPTGVTSIGENAFSDCSSLESIEIPSSVTSIGKEAFYRCSSLTRVYYGGDSEAWSAISIDLFNTALTSATRYYYSESEPNLNAEGTAYDGNYWHYDTDGVTPVIWVKEN